MADTGKVSYLFVVFFVILSLTSAGIPRILRGRPKGGLLGVPPLTKNVKLPSDMWFDDQNLDHFNDADNTKWSQRYFVNDTFHKAGGPLFIMIGGEGAASPIWMVEGAWVERYAPKYNAFCIQLEHRFYGKSHPTEDMSVENLKYLSSEQALADIANFIQFAKEKYSLMDSKVVTIGGSYSGALAAWMRLKYPHITDASIATSAPIYAELNFIEYLGVVRDSLDTTGSQCNMMIKQATQMFGTMMQSQAGRDKLRETFSLCDDIDPNNMRDISTLYTNLAGNFEGVVQYNKDNRAFEGAVGTNITIDTLCSIMTDDSRGSPLLRYADVNAMMLKAYSEPCLDFNYDKMIKDLQMTSWNSSASEGGRQWTYQTCVEFGWYQSSDLSNQPFGNNFPVSYSVQQCMDIFGSDFTLETCQRGINRTNTNYGGRDLKVTRVVFPNGSIDPWHAMGVTKNISEEAIAVYIKGTAHCANMYPEKDSDRAELMQARNTIEEAIGHWLM